MHLSMGLVFIFRYEKDNNSVPPQMILQPITKILPHFLSRLMPAKQEADQKEWWRIYCEIQGFLKEATSYLYRVSSKQHKNCFGSQAVSRDVKSSILVFVLQSGIMSYAVMRRYHNSVIEHECTAGIVEIPKGKSKNTCAAFLREIKNLNLQDKRGGRGYNLYARFEGFS